VSSGEAQRMAIAQAGPLPTRIGGIGGAGAAGGTGLGGVPLTAFSTPAIGTGRRGVGQGPSGIGGGMGGMGGQMSAPRSSNGRDALSAKVPATGRLANYSGLETGSRILKQTSVGFGLPGGAPSRGQGQGQSVQPSEEKMLKQLFPGWF
jgi:hypothetical protein